jgi:hypothetical protein
MSNFIKIRPAGVQLFHADGRTDEEANSRFPQFRERAYNHLKATQLITRHFNDFLQNLNRDKE